jgi:iron complex transport system ATP-binding protein
MTPSPASDEPILSLCDVTFRRNGNEILQGISWTVRPAEHWALLGANGSGKTTLLKLITGYEWATSGTVEVLGQRFGACNIPRLRRTIGWVSSALQEKLPAVDTAIRVVASGYDASLGLYRRLDTVELNHAEEALAWLGVAHLAARTYGTLSQGERQRVLIARALVNRPRLLILDEPCAGLDPRALRLFLDDLAALVRRPESPSILYVTHHIDEIGPWIGRVLVLKSGRVLAHGPVAATLTDGVLGDAFDCPCRVESEGQHFWLRLGG